MSSQLQQFLKIGDKLGIHSQSVCRKAVELDRLCEVRCSGGGLASLSFSGSCRTVLCLELAATSTGVTIDRKLATKLAGLTSTSYKSSLKTLQHMLDLDSVYSLRDIAVKFGCTEAVSQAQDMLARYRKDFEATASDNTKEDVNFDKPLFSCAALYAACRLQKIKVDKPKMIELTGAKRNAFDNLVAQLQKLADKPAHEKSKANKRGKNWLDDLENLADQEDLKHKRRSIGKETQEEEEDYEDWKRRILAATESCDT